MLGTRRQMIGLNKEWKMYMCDFKMKTFKQTHGRSWTYYTTLTAKSATYQTICLWEKLILNCWWRTTTTTLAQPTFFRNCFSDVPEMDTTRGYGIKNMLAM